MIVVERVDGRLLASEFGYGVTDEGEVLDELREMINEVVNCYFAEDDPNRPDVVTLVRLYDDELFAA